MNKDLERNLSHADTRTRRVASLKKVTVMDSIERLRLYIKSRKYYCVYHLAKALRALVFLDAALRRTSVLSE